MADWIGRRQPAGRPFGANRSAPGADHGNWLAAGQASEPTSQTEVQNTMEIIRSAPALFGASVRRQRSAPVCGPVPMCRLVLEYTEGWLQCVRSLSRARAADVPEGFLLGWLLGWLHLTCWVLSQDPSEQRAFRSGLRQSPLNPAGPPLGEYTIADYAISLNGVDGVRYIPPVLL